jgi:hypothetical protein
MYDEIMEGSWQTQPMTLQFRQWTHDFVLENSGHLASIDGKLAVPSSSTSKTLCSVCFTVNVLK